MVRFYAIFLIFLNLSIHSSQKKIFNDLLTDDNELAYIQPTSDKNKSSERLIEVLHPCANNLCNSDQVCVKSLTHSSSYECTNRTIEKTVKNVKKIEQKKQLKCNLLDHKLSLFEEFETLKKKQQRLISKLKINVDSSFCPESILLMLQKFDVDGNKMLNYSEWTSLDRLLNSCRMDFFKMCDKSKDNVLNQAEFCSCFSNTQTKCSFIRNPANVNTRQAYTKSVQIRLQNPLVSLNISNYTPMCDNSGNFLKQQCDKELRCWCVDGYGRPNANTLTFVSSKVPVQC